MAKSTEQAGQWFTGADGIRRRINKHIGNSFAREVIRQKKYQVWDDNITNYYPLYPKKYS